MDATWNRMRARWRYWRSHRLSLGRFLLKILDSERRSKRCRFKDVNACRNAVVGHVWPVNFVIEPRILLHLANIVPVVRRLRAAIDEAVDTIKPGVLGMKLKLYKNLRQEQSKVFDFFEALIRDTEWLQRELGNEIQQVEIATRLKHSLQCYGNELTAREIDVMSAVFDAVTRLSNVVIGDIPEYFVESTNAWDNSGISEFDGEEESLRNAFIWSELNHPNIRQFLGMCHVGENPFIVHEQTKELTSFSWASMLDFARGLSYLHERSIALGPFSERTFQLCSSHGVLSGMGLTRLSQHDNRSIADVAEGLEGDLEIYPSVSADILIFNFHLTHLLRGREDFRLQGSWQALATLCTENATMAHVAHEIQVLINAPGSLDSANESAIIEDLKSYTFLGETVEAMLDDAAELCTEMKTLEQVNRPVLDRLVEIYTQFQRISQNHPLQKKIMDDFGLILSRFVGSLDQRLYTSMITSFCASRTLAGRNYSIHHDIDRLFLDTPMLSNLAPVHSWQTIWKHGQQAQRAAFQRCLENPQMYLNEPNCEAERRAAMLALSFEARCNGVESDNAKLANLMDIENVNIPSWYIPSFEVELGRHLADGAFGAVYEGIWLGTSVAIKQVLTDQGDAVYREQFHHETELWFSLKHSNIVKLYGACPDEKPFFVCERATGTLLSFIQGKTMKEIWKCMHEAALGLRYLHNRGIVYGDLKCNNILVCGDVVKLADFGLSFDTSVDDGTVGENGALGAYRWKSPECLMGERPTLASDIYSFGMCIIEAISGQLPWGNSMTDEVIKYLVTRRRQLPDHGDIGYFEWKLIEQMCCFDPAERIPVGTVVRSTYAWANQDYWDV